MQTDDCFLSLVSKELAKGSEASAGEEKGLPTREDCQTWGPRCWHHPEFCQRRISLLSTWSSRAVF